MAALCPLGPGMLLHWAECQVVSACGRRTEDGVMRSRMFPPPGDSDPLSACTSCLRSCDVKAAQQHQLQYRDADIQLRRA